MDTRAGLLCASRYGQPCTHLPRSESVFYPMPPGSRQGDFPQSRSFKYTWLNRITMACGYTVVSVVILGGSPVPDGEPLRSLVRYLGLGAYLVGLIRILSIGIIIRSDSIVIRNVFRTHRIHLSEVISVEWAPKYELSQLRIRLTSGRVVTPTAVKIQGPKDGGLDAAYAIRHRLSAYRGDPMPSSPAEMMRLGRLPPPPVGNGPPR